MKSARSLMATACVVLATGAVHAESFASSAISNSVSASVGSISTSFNASSDASSPGRPLRTGAWRITEVAEAPGREGYARLALRAEPAAGEAASAQTQFQQFLFLPVATVAQASLGVGQVIHARARPYGLELAKAQPGETQPAPFFLVVADDVYRELQTRPVKL